MNILGGGENSRLHATHSIPRLIKNQPSKAIATESQTAPTPQSQAPSPGPAHCHHAAMSRHSAAPAHHRKHPKTEGNRNVRHTRLALGYIVGPLGKESCVEQTSFLLPLVELSRS